MQLIKLLPKDQKVQVGKDQEKAQSEKDSHSKNRKIAQKLRLYFINLIADMDVFKVLFLCLAIVTY